MTIRYVLFNLEENKYLSMIDNNGVHTDKDYNKAICYFDEASAEGHLRLIGQKELTYLNDWAIRKFYKI